MLLAKEKGGAGAGLARQGADPLRESPFFSFVTRSKLIAKRIQSILAPGIILPAGAGFPG
jgi:hypothetical protein